MAFLLLHTDTNNRRPQATPNRPYQTLSRSYGHIVGACTDIVKTGDYPTKSDLYDCDPWTIKIFIQLDKGFMQM